MFTKHRPLFPVFATPTYSNSAYHILAYALEAIKKKPFPSMLAKDLFQKLDMKGSSYKMPADSSKAVIPGDETSSGWSADIGDDTP
jgi:CubicO group peptidase (beta-lactamase class C family)